MLNIVFMGSDAIALPLLDWLAGNPQSPAKVVAVFTQPDRAVGRGQKVQANAIKQWAQARGLPVHQPEKLTAAELATLRGYQPDLSLIMAYGHILRREFIDAPRLGTLNLHTSLLPKYRGASPIQTAVASGDAQTGVTLMRIVPALDAGPMAGAETVDIAPHDTALEVEVKLSQACVPLLARTLPLLAEGRLTFQEQNESAATFCRKLEKTDGVLDFATPAAQLSARINGLFPWPACTVELNGQPMKFGLADAPASPNSSTPTGYASSGPGTVLGADTEGLLIATGRGTLRVRRLQRPGGKMLPAGEFLRGCPIATGTVLSSQPMPALVASQPFPRKK